MDATDQRDLGGANDEKKEWSEETVCSARPYIPVDAAHFLQATIADYNMIPSIQWMLDDRPSTSPLTELQFQIEQAKDQPYAYSISKLERIFSKLKKGK